MPLSDHEQRILDEIEKNLYREDPAFARQRGHRRSGRDQRTRARLGALIFGVGFIGLFAFFYSRWVIVGVLAFAAMVLGIVTVTAGLRAMTPRDLVRGPTDRLSRALSDWEERVRQRYKKE